MLYYTMTVLLEYINLSLQFSTNVLLIFILHLSIILALCLMLQRPIIGGFLPQILSIISYASLTAALKSECI